MNFGLPKLRTDARLSFQQSRSETSKLGIHGIQKPESSTVPTSSTPSDEDKKKFETGNTLVVVELKNPHCLVCPSFVTSTNWATKVRWR